MSRWNVDKMLGSLFRSQEERAIQVTPWGQWGGSGSSHAGVTVDSGTSLQLLAVYGCVGLIANTISTLPIDVYRKSGSESVPVVTPSWLDQPNGHADIVELMTQILSSLLLDGNAYVQVLPSYDFVGVRELSVLSPSKVQIRVERGQAVYYVDNRPVETKLVHVKAWSLPGEIKGVDPINAARHSIGLGLAAQEFGSKFFSNGAHLSGVIEVPGDMTADQGELIKAKWGRAHQGLAKAHEPGVLTGGAHWVPIAISPEQAQFLQTRQFSAAEIAGQLFFVDPTLLGIAQSSTSLTYANLEQRGIHLTTFTLLPWIVRLERLFTALLPKAQFVKLNVGGLQRADMKTRYEAYAIGTGGAPFLTQNEPREKEDLPPLAASEFPVKSAAPTIGGPNGP